MITTWHKAAGPQAIQTISTSKKYLWNYEIIKYTGMDRAQLRHHVLSESMEIQELQAPRELLEMGFHLLQTIILQQQHQVVLQRVQADGLPQYRPSLLPKNIYGTMKKSLIQTEAQLLQRLILLVSMGILDLLAHKALKDQPGQKDLKVQLLRQYMHNTEIAVTMRLSTILKTIKQPL
mgnify:CR=1 FL=1